MSAAVTSNTSSPASGKELSRDDFDAALKKAQLSMDNISKDLQKRHKSAEEHIQCLQNEMEELRFFHELDDSDDDDSGLSDIRSLRVTRSGVNDGAQLATCTFESFTAAAAAVAEAEDTNQKLKKQLEVRLVAKFPFRICARSTE